MRARLAGMVVCVAGFSVFALAQERYDTRELRPVRGHKASVVRALTTEGRAVGYSVKTRRGIDEISATVWDASGRPHKLTWDGPFQLDGYQTEAVDINERGDILGVGRRPDKSEVVLYWPNDGSRPHWLEIHGQVRRAGVNDEGLVFVEAHDEELRRDVVRVVRFEEHFKDNQLLPGVAVNGATHAFDITADGTVIGSAVGAAGPVAVAWVYDLAADAYSLRALAPTEGMSVARASGPEERGDTTIVGLVAVGERVHAATWEEGILRDLGVPHGFEETEAFGADRDGYVACIARSYDMVGNVASDALWLTRLGRGDEFFVATEPLVRLSTVSIAPDGRLAVNGAGEDGRPRALLLTPRQLLSEPVTAPFAADPRD